MTLLARLDAVITRFEKIGKMRSEAVDWADELRAIRAEVAKRDEAVRSMFKAWDSYVASRQYVGWDEVIGSLARLRAALGEGE